MKRLLIWIGGGCCVLATASFLLPLAAVDIELDRIMQGPGWGAWLGYDELGRPILDRLILGTRNSLLISLTVAALCFVIGVPIGILSAFLGGAWDRVLVWLTDVFLAFPGLLLAIAITGLLGPGLQNAILALSITGWVSFARLSRAQTLSIRRQDHVVAAHALGTPVLGIAWKHILPLLGATLGVQLTYEIAGVIIAESTLSFLGLGVQPPTPSLGSMILEGYRYMLVAPHIVLAPGLTIMMLVLSINLLGDRLRDHWDVRNRAAQS